MRFAVWIFLGWCGGILWLANTPEARADAIPAEYRSSIQKGLEWLVKQQCPDGHWEASGGQYPVVLTALSGFDTDTMQLPIDAQ